MRTFWKSFVGVAAGVFVITSATNVVGKTIVIENPQFNNPTALHLNSYWPLTEGMSYAYIAETEDGCEFNKLTVLADTGGYSNKFIKGIQMRVVRDQEWEAEPPDGVECADINPNIAVLKEDTLDYYAIDDAFNTWYYGEDTWAVDDESPLCTDDGAWEAGQPAGEEDEAVEGVVMLSQPQPGDRYQQEFWEDEAEDWAKVNRLNGKIGDEYSQCLVTKEWTPLEPGSVEHKYYCLTPFNSGLVFIKELQGKTVEVEFVGADFGFGALPGEGAGPGDGVDFPALDNVGSCIMP
jgi:hypothetical protein